jgi:hypothetical protein
MMPLEDARCTRTPYLCREAHEKAVAGMRSVQWSISGAGVLTLSLGDSDTFPLAILALAIRTGLSLVCVGIFGKAAGIFP